MTPNKVATLLTKKIITVSPEFTVSKENIRFGLEWLILNIYQVLFIYAITLPFNILLETTVCLLTIILIRTFIGGPHLTNTWLCMFASTATVITLVFLGKSLSNIQFIGMLIYMSFPLFIFMIWKYAPKLYKMSIYLKKKKTRQKILSSLSLIIIYIYIISIGTDNPLSTISWIVIIYLLSTITPIGEKIILGIDQKLNTILTRR